MQLTSHSAADRSFCFLVRYNAVWSPFASQITPCKARIAINNFQHVRHAKWPNRHKAWRARLVEADIPLLPKQRPILRCVAGTPACPVLQLHTPVSASRIPQYNVQDILAAGSQQLLETAVMETPIGGMAASCNRKDCRKGGGSQRAPKMPPVTSAALTVSCMSRRSRAMLLSSCTPKKSPVSAPKRSPPLTQPHAHTALHHSNQVSNADSTKGEGRRQS